MNGRKRCAGCVYYENIGSGIGKGCHYCYYTGRSRGVADPEKCDKYTPCKTNRSHGPGISVRKEGGGA